MTRAIYDLALTTYRRDIGARWPCYHTYQFKWVLTCFTGTKHDAASSSFAYTRHANRPSLSRADCVVNAKSETGLALVGRTLKNAPTSSKQARLQGSSSSRGCGGRE